LISFVLQLLITISYRNQKSLIKRFRTWNGRSARAKE